MGCLGIGFGFVAEAFSYFSLNSVDCITNN